MSAHGNSSRSGLRQGQESTCLTRALPIRTPIADPPQRWRGWCKLSGTGRSAAVPGVTYSRRLPGALPARRVQHSHPQHGRSPAESWILYRGARHLAVDRLRHQSVEQSPRTLARDQRSRHNLRRLNCPGSSHRVRPFESRSRRDYREGSRGCCLVEGRGGPVGHSEKPNKNSWWRHSRR
jgi:hypothetical protein